MASAHFLSSTMAMEELATFGSLPLTASDILHLTMQIAVLGIIVFSAACFFGLQTPKVSAVGQALRHEHPVQKKKGKRAKKTKKAGDAVSSKCTLVAPVISEEELIAVTVQPESDMKSVETTSLPLESSTNVASDNASCIAPAPTCLERCCMAVEPSITNEGQAASDVSEELSGTCEMCSKNVWGCSIHRTYSSALLLRHFATQCVIARGPPGLELPVNDRKSSKPMCRLQMKAVSELAA
jgi:hypothetical protein